QGRPAEASAPEALRDGKSLGHRSGLYGRGEGGPPTPGRGGPPVQRGGETELDPLLHLGRGPDAALPPVPDHATAGLGRGRTERRVGTPLRAVRVAGAPCLGPPPGSHRLSGGPPRTRHSRVGPVGPIPKQIVVQQGIRRGLRRKRMRLATPRSLGTARPPPED